MTDLTTLLKDGDPIQTEDGLAAADAERMRRRIVAAALEPAPTWTPWHRPLAVAAIAVLLIVVGTIRNDRSFESTVVSMDSFAAQGGSSDGDRRQLQFSTPGGTRIIWIFDENLRLQGAMP